MLPESLDLSDILSVEKPSNIEKNLPGLTLKEYCDNLCLTLRNSKDDSIYISLPDLENDSSVEKVDEIIKKVSEKVKTREPIDFEELLCLYKQVCCTYLLKGSLSVVPLQSEMLHQTFLIDVNDWDICPVHVHVACKCLFDCLTNDRNLLHFARKICTISRMGFNMSICLVYAALFRAVGKPIKMFRPHKLSVLVELLEEIDMDVLKQDPNLVYTLLQIVSFFQNVAILKQSDFVCKLLASYFQNDEYSLNALKEWCRQIDSLFPVQVTDKNPEADNSIISELVKIDILPLFEEYTTILKKEGEMIVKQEKQFITKKSE